MRDAHSMERCLRALGFGPVIGWSYRPALMVSDDMRACTAPMRPLGAHWDRALAATVRGVRAAREAAIPLSDAARWSEEQDWRDTGRWATQRAGVMCLRAGSPDMARTRRLGRRADAAMLVNTDASVFCGTDVVAQRNAPRGAMRSGPLDNRRCCLTKEPPSVAGQEPDNVLAVRS